MILYKNKLINVFNQMNISYYYLTFYVSKTAFLYIYYTQDLVFSQTITIIFLRRLETD